MVHRSASAIALAFALVACGQSAEAPPVPAGPSAWSVESHGVGMELTLLEPGVRLTLVCHDAPAVMQLRVDSFQPIGSEERIAFGAGDDPYVFVAQLDDDRPGVTGERDISLAFLDALSAAPQWQVSYAAQHTGPLDAPPPEAIQTFVAACRAIVAG